MNENNKHNQKYSKGKQPKMKFNMYWLYAIIIAIIIGFWLSGNDTTVNKTLEWDKLKNVILKHDYNKIIVVNQKYAEVYIKPEEIKTNDAYKDLRVKQGIFVSPKADNEGFYTYNFVNYDDFREKLRDVENQWIVQDTAGVQNEVQKQKIISDLRINVQAEERGSFWDGGFFNLIIWILVMVLMWVFIARMMRGGAGGSGGIGGGIFSVGKSKAKLYDKEKDVQITFADVAGLEEAKVEVMEIVDFLKSPKKYTNLGGKIPKGALLVGPPGTGKTLLARAVAGEARVPFFSLSGSDFVEMFVGVGASRVRDLFKTAKEKAPCIIFIDEIDAIGRARGKNLMSGSNDERENTLNQLLTEMDGFGTNAGVIILAATNRADILDKALLRAGRFDRQIHVELPDVEERKAIFAVHTKNLKYNKEEVDTDFLAKQTPGFSGADIANICNEAALIAARHDKKIIGKQDFLDAVDRIIGGLEKRNKIISPKEKRVIAYHEAGHASVSWLLEHANPLVKVTIVPRGQALGAAWYLPEERQITTRAQMLDQIISTLGGRASEEVVFGEISTGALNDLERVTKQAYAMVAYYGLNDKLGNVSYYDSTGQSEYGFNKPFSEKTAEQIDAEIHALIEECYTRAKEILVTNREKLDQLAEILITREVIFREDVEAIFGKRPWDEEKTITQNTESLSKNAETNE
jgi:cell division protease FtsH